MNLFLAALGGAIGTVLRYKLSGIILFQFPNYKFPLNTFLINVIGCLIIGILAGLSIKENYFSQNMKVFLFTGICGGFTTFSAFGLDTLYLLQKQELLMALSYVILSVVIGILILALGFYIFK